MSIAIELERVLILDASDEQFIQLRECVDASTSVASAIGRVFSIKIGTPEAIAIERRLRGYPAPRPQTHDLLAAAIQTLGAKVLRVEIHALEEGTFFANIVMQRFGESDEIALDARPSDAIALAVGLHVPLFATESVLEIASESPIVVEPPVFDTEDGEDD
ncbi:MAG: bifunctional nuclease family protein [Phycisphaerales bacterium]|nr:bifunctional nuclease family protein [Phycisphaerales bacterium]